MRKIILHIESLESSTAHTLDGELSIGRGSNAGLPLEDTGLSRINTTFFREDEELFAVDENSTNGTFVNGHRLSNAPYKLTNRDEITLGSHTKVLVEIADGAEDSQVRTPFAESPKSAPVTAQTVPPAKAKRSYPLVLVAAIGMIILIIGGGLLVLLISSLTDKNTVNKNAKPNQPPPSTELIPVRVIDPLGGEDAEDLDDIMASWEGVEEEELKTANVDEVKAVSTGGASDAELNVPIDFWVKQRNSAFSARNMPIGIDPGLRFFPELGGGSVYKQKLKLGEMIKQGYKQPMDFSDLAQKRINKELIELPIATEWYFLDVGGSASEKPFEAYSFEMDNTPIAEGSAKYLPLKQLADNFAGQKYDLNNGRDRRQMRIRLLRMFHPNAKPILEELAKAYHQKFGRPLRVTSLTRSMDYQIGLNATNANSFKVRGPGSLPPHTSGCAFDLARKHMTADEQNFVQEKLAEMERRGSLDALREGGANACFHVFIYPDGKEPK